MSDTFFRPSLTRATSPWVRTALRTPWRQCLVAGALLGLLWAVPANADEKVGNPAQVQTALADDVEVVQASTVQAIDTQMQALQQYIGDTYRVPLQSVQTMVEAAWQVGDAMELDPILLLAIMAIESSFNVKAESHMGAQGLMQVMTKIHRKRFEPHGGIKTAFNPEVNIQIGAQILQECIERRGSLLGGLTCYVGASGTTSHYGNKVLAKADTLRDVVGDMADTVLVAVAEPATTDITHDDHVIEAPPISSFVEADAPRLARSLLDERDAVDL